MPLVGDGIRTVESSECIEVGHGFLLPSIFSPDNAVKLHSALLHPDNGLNLRFSSLIFTSFFKNVSSTLSIHVSGITEGQFANRGEIRIVVQITGFEPQPRKLREAKNTHESKEIETCLVRWYRISDNIQE